MAIALWRRRLAAAYAAGGDPSAVLRTAPTGPLRLIDRARAAARAGEPARARELAAGLAPEPAGGSFVELEARLCARGCDGPAGLLAARGADLAHLAAAGSHPRAAAAALALLESAGRLRPDAPSVWLAVSAAERALQRPQRALAAAERACLLAPGDPAPLLARAEALFAAASSGAPDLERLGEAGALVRAWDARLRDAADPGLEREALAAVAAAGEAFAAARDAAQAAGAARIAATARIGVARALVERRRLGAEVAPGAVSREVAPLLARLDVRALAEAREALAQALEDGVPDEVRRSEDRLASLRPDAPLDATRLGALLLVASEGGPAAAAHAQTLAALAGDLPARALRAYDAAVASRDEAAARAALARARRLAPELPHPVLALAFLDPDPEAPDAWRRLGETIVAAPEWAALLARVLPLTRSAAGLQTDAAALAPALTGEADGPPGELALAVATMAELERPSVLERWRDEDRSGRALQAARASARAIRGLAPGDAAGAWLVHATALSWLGEGTPRTGFDERVRPDFEHALACAAAGVPWSPGPLLVALSADDEPRGVLRAVEALLTAGYVNHSEDLPSLRRTFRGRRLLEGYLRPLVEAAEGVDRRRPEQVLGLARRLEELQRWPRLSLVLRLVAQRRRDELLGTLRRAPGGERLESERVAHEHLLGGPALPADLAARIREEAGPGTALEAQLLARWAAAAPPSEPGQVRARRQAWLATTRARTPGATEVLAPRQVRAIGRLLRLPFALSEAQHELVARVQPDPDLGAEHYRLQAPEASLALIAQLDEPGEEAAVWDDLPTAPWARSQVLLRTLQDAAAQTEAAAWLLEQGAWGELRLALERAAAFRRDLREEGSPHRLASWLRAEAARREGGADRERLLRLALGLVREGAETAPNPAPLRGLEADLLLDLAGLAPVGQRRQAHVAAALEAAEAAPAHRISETAEPPALVAYRRLRLRVCQRDPEGAAAAADEVRERVGPLGFLVRGWIQADPLLPLIAEVDPLDRFLRWAQVEAE